MAVAVLAVFVTARIVMVWWRWRRLCRRASTGLIVTSAPEAFAYVEPGAGGAIVASRGLMEGLAVPERRAVIAHEYSHRVHRHDRYLALAVVVDPLPGIRRVGDALRRSIERWADEDAAASVGDRRVVAAAIARVGVASAPGPFAASGSGGDALQRVHALLGPAPSIDRPWSAMAVAAAMTALAGAQGHQLVSLTVTLCPH